MWKICMTVENCRPLTPKGGKRILTVGKFRKITMEFPIRELRGLRDINIPLTIWLRLPNIRSLWNQNRKRQKKLLKFKMNQKSQSNALNGAEMAQIDWKSGNQSQERAVFLHF